MAIGNLSETMPSLSDALGRRLMNTIQKYICGLAVALFLSFIPSASAASEYLYVLENVNELKTYSVSPITAKPTLIGHVRLVPTSKIQIVHNPTSSFLYVVGFVSPTSEFIWTYSIDSKGVVNADPIQTLPVKPALANLVIQPGGRFAYALYAWTQTDEDDDTYYVSDVVLFTIKDGKLTNTRKALVNFPPDDEDSTTIYGMNSKGTELYTVANCQTCLDDGELTYNVSTVNTKTGALGKPIEFWSDTVGEGGILGYSAFSDALIAQPDNVGAAPLIGFFANTASAPLVFNCTATMAQPCGDFVYQAAFDPSGKYLLVIDGTTSTVPILEVNPTNQTATELKDYLPGYVFPFFSHDGKVVYAIEGNSVLINTFNPANGDLGDHHSLSIPAGASLTAW
jgi:hypothetical protein